MQEFSRLFLSRKEIDREHEGENEVYKHGKHIGSDACSDVDEVIRVMSSICIIIYPDNRREVVAPNEEQSKMLERLGVSLV